MRTFFSFLLLCALTVQGAENSGLAFLKIGVDARAAAMGNAAGAVLNDAAAGFWNPAGIAQSRGQSLVLTHNVWLQGVDHEFGAIQFLQGRHNLAASINMVNIPGIEIRGERPTDQPDAVTSAHNVYFALNYARVLSDNFYAGLQVKYLYEKYYLASATGFALDLGVTKKDLFKDVDGALSIMNLGIMEKLDDVSSTLPLTARLSAAWHTPLELQSGKMLLAADLLLIKGNDPQVNIGVEIPLLSMLAMRGGYVLGRESMGWSAGAGLSYASYHFDYAYMPFDFDLGNAHRFTLRFDL